MHAAADLCTPNNTSLGGWRALTQSTAPSHTTTPLTGDPHTRTGTAPPCTRPLQYDYYVPAEAVHGTLPKELRGTLFLIGPALTQAYGTAVRHPSDADGMVRGWFVRNTHRAVVAVVCCCCLAGSLAHFNPAEHKAVTW